MNPNRFLDLGGSSGHGQASGGGSGNFLFDIIRVSKTEIKCQSKLSQIKNQKSIKIVRRNEKKWGWV